jgi:hypothetical protein
MANLITRSVPVDGMRNTVVTIEGYFDTSDIAASGQIGSAGFTTTTGLKTITFTAGALTPTLGQFVTFSDGTTTFPAGTYITSIVSATSITVNNAATATNAAAAITITGTAGGIVIADPAVLSAMDDSGTRATRLRINEVHFSTEGNNTVTLQWNATSKVRAFTMTQSHTQSFYDFGGLQNPYGAGADGKILLITEGWSASAVNAFYLALELVKS